MEIGKMDKKWQLQEPHWFIVKMVSGIDRDNRLFQGSNVIFWRKVELCEECSFKM
jgi:hypothetical protein